MRRAAELAPAGRALDLACGAGRNALHLAEQGWRVEAVDASDVAVRLLQDEALRRHLAIDTFVADLEIGFTRPPLSFDLVIDVDYLQRDLFPKAGEWLRRGGLFAAEIGLLLEGRTPHINPQFLLRRGELPAILAAPDWEIIHAREFTEVDRPHAELIVRKV